MSLCPLLYLKAVLFFTVSIPVVLYFYNYAAILINAGNSRLSHMSMATTGKAIAVILKTFDKAKYRILHAAVAIVRQNVMLDIT